MRVDGTLFDNSVDDSTLADLRTTGSLISVGEAPMFEADSFKSLSHAIELAEEARQEYLGRHPRS